MSGTLFALLDLGLAFGAMPGFGFGQLWLLRRDKRKTAARPQDGPGRKG